MLILFVCLCFASGALLPGVYPSEGENASTLRVLRDPHCVAQRSLLCFGRTLLFFLYFYCLCTCTFVFSPSLSLSPSLFVRVCLLLHILPRLPPPSFLLRQSHCHVCVSPPSRTIRPFHVAFPAFIFFLFYLHSLPLTHLPISPSFFSRPSRTNTMNPTCSHVRVDVRFCIARGCICDKGKKKMRRNVWEAWEVEFMFNSSTSQKSLSFLPFLNFFFLL